MLTWYAHWFYDYRAMLAYSWGELLMLISERYRRRRLVYSTIQDLTPESARDCTRCRGRKCGFCDYTGLLTTQDHQARMTSHLSAMSALKQIRAAEQALRHDAEMLKADAKRLFGNHWI